MGIWSVSTSSTRMPPPRRRVSSTRRKASTTWSRCRGFPLFKPLAHVTCCRPANHRGVLFFLECMACNVSFVLLVMGGTGNATGAASGPPPFCQGLLILAGKGGATGRLFLFLYTALCFRNPRLLFVFVCTFMICFFVDVLFFFFFSFPAAL